MFTPASAPLRPDQPRAACADRLDLVDEAFKVSAKRGPSPELERLCRQCPVASECFAHAMANPEAGVWAGTSSYMRKQQGGASRA